MESLHKRLTKLIRQMEDLGQDTTDVQKRRAFLNAVVDKNWEETVMRIREQSAGMSSLEVFQRLQGVEKQLLANAKMRELHGASSSNIGLASIPAGKGDKVKGRNTKTILTKMVLIQLLQALKIHQVGVHQRLPPKRLIAIIAGRGDTPQKSAV